MDDKTLRKVRRWIRKAEKDFVPMPAGAVSRYGRKDLRNLENNFQLYAEALSNIDLLIDGKKEIWANCPYCGLKFTKIVKETETKKGFWCETCKKHPRGGK
jgi:hypothetical protein